MAANETESVNGSALSVLVFIPSSEVLPDEREFVVVTEEDMQQEEKEGKPIRCTCLVD